MSNDKIDMRLKANRPKPMVQAVPPLGPTPKPYAPRTAEERQTAERKRPLFGVRSTKLDVDYEIPGMQLAWITDYDDGRLQFALECGYQYVKQSEVKVSNTQSDVVKDADTSDRISRYAGQSESNRPVRTYLMKIEQEIYEEAKAEINAQSDFQENQLYAGDHTDLQGKYIPTSIATKIGSKIV
jgi:hypothetical protein